MTSTTADLGVMRYEVDANLDLGRGELPGHEGFCVLYDSKMFYAKRSASGTQIKEAYYR